ncbi:MAG TPA: ABC transporter permease [Terriglobia bacterium]|nr:ABC transporter permease [Terriglobia bacterium]
MVGDDLRFAIRLFRKDAYLSLLVVLTLAIGIGATTAIFSVVNAVLLRPLPFPDADRLVVVWKTNLSQGYPVYYVSAPDYADLREQNTVLERMAAFFPQPLNLTGRGDPEQLHGMFVTPSLFPLLGVQADLGRAFLAEEESPGHDHVALMSHALWQRRFGSDPTLVGKSITLEGAPYMVAGIMPPRFDYPPFFDLRGGVHSSPPDVWLPLDLKSGKILGMDINSRSALSLEILGQLRPGVSLQEAQANLDTINARLEQEYPETNKDWGVTVVRLETQFTGKIREALLILLVAVAFVLAIGCANAANLLLARSVARQREIAIRSALGASRPRLLRQLLTESVLLALVGGVLGLALAYGGTRLLIQLSPATIPRLAQSVVDGRVLAFTLLVAVLTGVVFGLAPALQASKPNLTEALKEGSPAAAGGFGRLHLRNLLVVSEVALSFVLLIGAGLMMRSFVRLRAVNPGFDPHHLLTVRVRLSPERYPDRTLRLNFFREVWHRVEALPGVTSAGGIDSLPFGGGVGSYTFNIEGRPEVPPSERPIASYHVVTPSFFRTMSIQLLKGRFFSEEDDQRYSGVAVINETMARRFFPGRDPIGSRINFMDPPAPPVWLQVIGVVGDVRYDALDQTAGPDVYTSFLQPYPLFHGYYMALVVRTAIAPASLASAVRHEVLAVDKDQPVGAIRTMDDYLSASISKQRFAMVWLSVFAGMALTLAVLGIYGVISHGVGQRTREIGVRMALGAEPTDVLKLILRQSARLALVGAGIGLLVSLGLIRAISGLLYEARFGDAAVFVAVPAALVAAAIVAAYFPARRATGVAPTVALRHE